MKFVMTTLISLSAIFAVLAACFTAFILFSALTTLRDPPLGEVAVIVALPWLAPLGLSVVTGVLSFSVKSLGGDKLKEAAE